MALAASCPFAQAGTAGYVSTSTAAGSSLVGPTAVYAGEQSDINARETARREAQTKEAMQLLQEGRTAYKEGKYKVALEKFQAAWKRIPKAPVTQQWQKHIVDCIGDASIAVAIEYSKIGRYDDAEQLLLDVLSRDSNNKRARQELSMLRDPVRNNPALTPQHVRDVEEVNRLLTLAYGYYDLGKYNEAYAEFNRVLQIDPYNTAARKGQETISHRRSNYYRAAYNSFRAKALAEVDAQWEERVETNMPDMDMGSSAPVHTASAGQIRNEEALNNVQIAAVNFEETLMEDALDFLRAEVRKSGQQVNFVFEAAPAAAPAPAAPVASSDEEDEEGDGDEETSTPSAPTPVAAQVQPAVISRLQMNNLTAKELLDRMCSAAGCSYRVEDTAVVVSQAGAEAGKMMRRQWKVARTFVIPGAAGGDEDSGDEDDAFSGSSSSSRVKRPDAKAALTELGVTFPKGSAASYSPNTGILTVTNTLDNLDLVEDAIDAHRREKKNVMVKVSAKFVEVAQTNEDELSFDWVVNPVSISNSGNTYIGGVNGQNASTPRTYQNFATSGGSAYSNNHSNNGRWPISRATDSTIRDGLMTGGLRSGSGAISGNSLQSLIDAGSAASASSQNVAPGILSLSGIYNDGSYQAIMRGLSQKKGVDIMSAPSLIARTIPLEYSPEPDPLSTDQSSDDGAAKIEVIRRFIYASNYAEPQIPDRVDGVSAVAAPSSPDEWSAQELGIVLRFKIAEDVEDDVIKFDQFEIKVTDFEGFVNYGSPISVPQISTGSGGLGDLTNGTIGNYSGVSTSDEPVLLTENRIDMPIFSRRYINSNPCIYDGHTIAIGGMIEDQVQKVEDKVPVFGDLPLIGRFFRSNAESHTRKNLMIFVTAEKIDPTGKPMRYRDTGTGDAGTPVATPGLFPDDGLANP